MRMRSAPDAPVTRTVHRSLAIADQLDKVGGSISQQQLDDTSNEEHQNRNGSVPSVDGRLSPDDKPSRAAGTYASILA